MLFIDGVKQGVSYKNVGYWIQSYESAFETLTQLVVDQWALTTAILVDEGDCISLPVEAFDGQPIQGHLAGLELEWTQLLATKPSQACKSSEGRLKDWFLQLDAYHGRLLSHLEHVILLLEAHKRTALTRRNDALKRVLIRQYDCQLALNMRMYQQTQKDRQINQQRLLGLG